MFQRCGAKGRFPLPGGLTILRIPILAAWASPGMAFFPRVMPFGVRRIMHNALHGLGPGFLAHADDSTRFGALLCMRLGGTLGFGAIPGPLPLRVASIAFSLTFPEDARSYGISGIGATEEGHLYLGASFSLTSYDQGDLEHEKSAGGVIAHEVSSVAPGLSLCPMVGAVYSWVEDVSSWSIPFAHQNLISTLAGISIPSSSARMP